VQHEVDRLAVVLLHQLFEFHQRLGEGVIVIELDRAVKRDHLLRMRRERRRKQRQRRESGYELFHVMVLPDWQALFGLLPGC
jgi:hypothetical protein